MNSEQRVALITGATGAIGKAIARQLAAEQFEVVLAVRNKGKAEQAVKDIVQATGNDRVRYELVDVSRLSSILDLAGRWRGPLHVLINNAAVTPPVRQETPEGIELQFATNVLGYVWMLNALTETLQQSAPARVINVASYWAGGLVLDDLEFKRRRYNNSAAYRQSKQANRMLTVIQAEQWPADSITVNACHPGDVNSQLSNNLGFGGSQSAAEGADTPVWLATSPTGQQVTGGYFERRRQVRDPLAEDRVAAERLYELCLAYSSG